MICLRYWNYDQLDLLKPPGDRRSGLYISVDSGFWRTKRRR